jgi:hypothetical protein
MKYFLQKCFLVTFIYLFMTKILYTNFMPLIPATYCASLMARHFSLFPLLLHTNLLPAMMQFVSS